MSETRVVHCKREPYDVYIGRPSKWGNPFVAKGRRSKFEVSDHPDPIGAYRVHLEREILMGRLDPEELRGKVLGCWCKPGPCHGDVLAEFANRPAPPEEKER